jgi:hypothetical protein
MDRVVQYLPRSRAKSQRRHAPCGSRTAGVTKGRLLGASDHGNVKVANFLA